MQSCDLVSVYSNMMIGQSSKQGNEKQRTILMRSFNVYTLIRVYKHVFKILISNN